MEMSWKDAGRETWARIRPCDRKHSSEYKSGRSADRTCGVRAETFSLYPDLCRATPSRAAGRRRHALWTASGCSTSCAALQKLRQVRQVSRFSIFTAALILRGEGPGFCSTWSRFSMIRGSPSTPRRLANRLTFSESMETPAYPASPRVGRIFLMSRDRSSHGGPQCPCRGVGPM